MEIKVSGNQQGSGRRGGKKSPDIVPERRKSPRRQGNQLTLRQRVVVAYRFVLKTGMLILPALLIFAAVVFSLSSDTFNLRGISIDGCVHEEAGRLEKIIRGEFTPNILWMDLDAIQQRLEKETWIEQVELHRVLPSFLILRVRERVPSVLLELRGQQMVADKTGIRLGQYDKKFGKLNSPIFRGFLLMDNDPKTYETYQDENSRRVVAGVKLLTAIAAEAPAAARRISEIDLSDPKNMKLLLDDDSVEICMGAQANPEHFLRFVNDPERRYHELKSQGVELAQIDLSNNGQIVYRLKRARSRR